MERDFDIYPPYEVFYIESLLTITKSALNSIQTIFQIENELRNGKFDYNDELIDNLQNLINQAAALSKYFWPIGKNETNQLRGKFLRKVFEVDDNNPLKLRVVRNAIEHFDERLDMMTQDVISGNIIPFYIGKRPEVTGVKNYFFRAYFNDERVFHVLDNEFKVTNIFDEIVRIYEILIEQKKTGRLSVTTI